MLKKLVLIAAGAAVMSAGPVIAATRSAAPVRGVVASEHGVVLVAAGNGTVRAVHGHFAVGARVSSRNGHLGKIGGGSDD